MHDNVFEKVEEVLELFQPTSPTLMKSLPGPSNLFFGQEHERAMDQYDMRERHNFPKILEPTVLKVADEDLRHLNETGAQDPLEEWPTHDDLPMEASRFSRAQRMSLPASLDSITTPSGPKNQMRGSDHQIQRALSAPTHMPVKDSPSSSVASFAQTPSPQPCSCPRKTSASRILGSVRGKYLTVKAHIKFYFDVSAHYGVRTRW
jgi:hypothetical protein